MLQDCAVLTTVIIIWFAVAVVVSLALGRIFAVSQRHVPVMPGVPASSWSASQRVPPVFTIEPTFTSSKKRRRVRANRWATSVTPGDVDRSGTMNVEALLTTHE
jgi:hypothetical protein